MYLKILSTTITSTFNPVTKDENLVSIVKKKVGRIDSFILKEGRSD